eukprot:CAMPEP_0170350632 /NCGR_PEP_ID=MMETSP0116_2-20130129/76613_1 /TAXON_ID=400756 /ORGANISM="Durinskia baltica, Strain CSIRO CS-38" /LENGTH=320 /DNA_ID=CAMNT_0010604529 /DNA_START=62 /DNA_END=1020 /DNA_ORIENTATION=-
MAASTDKGVLESSRYCMMDCIPRSKKVSDGCAELTQDQAGQLMTASGNGKDPAELATPVAPELGREMPAENPPASPAEAEEAAQAADTQAFQEAAAAAAVAATEPPVPGIQQQNIERGALVADAAVKVQAAAVQAEIFARSAAETNKRAQAEIEELLAVPERAAEAVAAEAEEMFLRDAAKWDRLKTEGDAAIAAVMGTPPPARTWAGEQAAKPYAEAAQRAQAARLALEAQSSQLADLAQQLRQSASKVLAQSKAAASAGKEQLAEKLQIRMADYMQEAEDAQAASDNDADAAGKMQGAEEAYAKQAATAAERASVISR